MLTRITCALRECHSGRSARVAQSSGNAVDGQVDAAPDALVAGVRFFAAAMALDQLDLGYRIVAEGIETAAERDLLAGWGCDYGQGWHFARPMSAAAFAEWLDARGA